MTVEQFENELDDLVEKALAGLGRNEVILALRRAAEEVRSGGYSTSEST